MLDVIFLADRWQCQSVSLMGGGLWMHNCMLLTGAGGVEVLSGREHPLRRGQWEERTSGLNLRVLDLRL